MGFTPRRQEATEAKPGFRFLSGDETMTKQKTEQIAATTDVQDTKANCREQSTADRAADPNSLVFGDG